jgi:flavin-dependent dehydrogenase
MNKRKIAIIGAGAAGLSCALECERLGVPAEVFERHHSIGWIWPSISLWPDIFVRHYSNDPLKYIKDTFGINIKSSTDGKIFIMKSPNAQAKIEGNLGLLLYRGKEIDSVENQLSRELRHTPIHYNSLSNYNELKQKYEYVIVASGRDFEAKELGVWEEQGRVSIVGAIALGSFSCDTSTIYFDTEYAGKGYARVSPFSDKEAIIGIYIMNMEDFKEQQLDANRKLERFLEKEQLDKLELMYRFIIPPYSTGKVSRFQIDNVLFAGRAAGLTDRLLGTGGIEAIISGVLAARAIILGQDYDTLVKPLKEHIENISVFRNHLNNFNNDNFDKLITLLGTPGIKQLIYNTEINFADMAGNILNIFKT